VFLGLIQDRAVETRLQAEQPALHQQVIISKHSVLGDYQAVDLDKVKHLSAEQQTAIHELTGVASKHALTTTAIFPSAMFVAYLGLFLIFRSRGGYRAVALAPPPSNQP